MSEDADAGVSTCSYRIHLTNLFYMQYLPSHSSNAEVQL
jgi:hypothetical protein